MNFLMPRDHHVNFSIIILKHRRIATGCRLDGNGFDSALAPTQPPVQWVLGALSPGVKHQGREADHSPPSCTEVKNGGAIPPLPCMSSWHSKSYPCNRP
jgi:hypothetical protein